MNVGEEIQPTPNPAATWHKASDSLPDRLVHKLDLPGCNPSPSHLEELGLGGHKKTPGGKVRFYALIN